MSELETQAKQALAEIITDALILKNFVVEQAPDIVHQLIVWKTVMYGVQSSLLVFGIAVLVGVGVWAKRTKYPNEGHIVIFIIVPLFLGIPFIVVGTHGLVGFLKITLAPKVWLFEYAAGLM